MTTTAIDVHISQSNIFADLDLPDADAHFLKAKIVAELYRLVDAEGLTQAAAGQRMGISQPEVSRLFKGNFREYSVERLIGFLTSFNQDVELVIRPRKDDSARGEVTLRREAT
jgi:predicted XRE-type DNA-binding protein